MEGYQTEKLNMSALDEIIDIATLIFRGHTNDFVEIFATLAIQYLKHLLSN